MQEDHNSNTQVAMQPKIKISVIVAGVILGIIVLYLALETPIAGSIAAAIEPHCYIGVTDTNASITISGISAPQVCTTIIQQEPNIMYAFSEAPTNSIVCEFDAQRNHFIIRDEGIFKLVGAALFAAQSAFSNGTPLIATPNNG